MNIEIMNISKVIGKQAVLKQITLSLNAPGIYGLKGRNGAGKTMLMRAICGLIRLSEGEILIDGKVLRKEISFPPSVGILIENSGFIPNYSGYENLKTLIEIRNIVPKERISQIMETVGLDPSEKKPFRKYSLGMKQKLGIAAAIIEEPDLIILDEPTNGLDEKSREKLKEILRYQKERGALIILSCYDTEDLMELSDVIIEMRDGEVVAEWEVEKK